MAYPRRTGYLPPELMDEIDNSLAARKRQVAERITSLEGFRFQRSGVIIDRSIRNTEIVAALAKDGHLVSRQTAEARAVAYVKGLLMAANRLWPLVVQTGKRLFFRQLAQCSFNRMDVSLSRNQIELLLPALVRAREHHLVRIAAQTNAPPTQQYSAPTDMTEAAAQYLMVRMTEILRTEGIVFRGVPMSQRERAEVRERARPMGQARRNNRRGTRLSTSTFVQSLVPITEMGRQASGGRTATEWFALIDHIGAMDGGLAGRTRG
ncbi:hypothetical protein PLICBS_000316 [Purpureocillium lilacinum]|uniref:uncharacterized protein n=1 Tax=Purpureocillium lilacinum TaxID=33203 RepID=UPI0020804B57|nr:hypothetical protein PLICBS_000316 [Purpureocillium lilacinum]